jgi:hypothetical protein
MSHAGFSKVHVPIDNSRKNMFALRIDLFFALRELIVSADGDEFFAADRNASLESFGGRYHPAILNN